MSAIAGLFSFVPGWLWAAVVAASMLHGCWVGHQRDAAQNDLHTLQASTAKADAARAQIALLANSNFRKFEHQQAATAAELENANLTHHDAAQVVDDRNRATVDGLRRDVARLDAAARGRAVPSTSAYAGELEASRRAAEVARGLFLACTAEYQQLGSDAKRDAIDLDTALKYGDLVQTTAPQ